MQLETVRSDKGGVSVYIVPSDSEGAFLIETEDYGVQLVKRIGLLGLKNTEREELAAGRLAVLSAHLQPGEASDIGTRINLLNCVGVAYIEVDGEQIDVAPQSYIEVPPVWYPEVPSYHRHTNNVAA